MAKALIVLTPMPSPSTGGVELVFTTEIQWHSLKETPE